MTKEEREVTRQEVVARAKAILADAYAEAAEIVVLYLEQHPSEQLQPLCKEIDPDNWNGLRRKVQRAQAARKVSHSADSSRADRVTDRGMGSYGRHTRQVLRDATPEELRDVMRGLPTERRAEVVRAAVPPPERTSRPQSGPTFIELIVRVNSALIELEALVASWQNTAAIPAEFSQDSFNDIVAKVERIRRHFDQVEETRDDDDEFQKIVRNFRLVATDVG
jgi:hypothetical protein